MDAVREGVKKGAFGYGNEIIAEKDGKYVADINKEVNVEWNGWVIKKDLVYQEAVSEPILTKPLVTSTLAASSPVQDAVYEQYYTYGVDFADLREIVHVLEKYPILSIGRKFIAECNIELKNDSDTITIQSKLKQSLELKSLLQSLLSTNRYIGTGNMIFKSDKDLNNDLERYKINAKRL